MPTPPAPAPRAAPLRPSPSRAPPRRAARSRSAAAAPPRRGGTPSRSARVSPRRSLGSRQRRSGDRALNPVDLVERAGRGEPVPVHVGRDLGDRAAQPVQSELVARREVDARRRAPNSTPRSRATSTMSSDGKQELEPSCALRHRLRHPARLSACAASSTRARSGGASRSSMLSLTYSRRATAPRSARPCRARGRAG